MNQNTACTSMLFTLFVFVLNGRAVEAQTVVINYADRGSYDSTGFHLRTSQNYAVGDLRGVSCTVGGCNDDFRNFFVFDLSSVVTPIASAKLALFVPAPPPTGAGFSSPDPSENYELHDIDTPIVILQNGTGGVPAHTDLGSGIVYGSRTMTAADIGQVIEIELNSSAIAALDAATGLIAIGGSITTLDGLANDEYTFSGSNLGTETTELRLTVIPEPSTVLLCLAGIFATLMRRNLFRHKH